MSAVLPDWLDPKPWLKFATTDDSTAVRQAIHTSQPGPRELALLLSPKADALLEPMARRARDITLRRFGKTITLYAPLYVSNHCPGGCAYCGFAADRKQVRRRLDDAELARELDTLHKRGLDDVLLLTGERTPLCGPEFLCECVKKAASRIHSISVESFAMTEAEYGQLAGSGCIGITLYQETYDPELYNTVHRWGPKRDYADRLTAPERALTAGMRYFGLGVLLGLGDPVYDALSLYLHLQHLRRIYWRAEFSISFPRLRPEAGGFQPRHDVDERMLARLFYAFRICLPDVTLVLSTRESARFRDHMAGTGVNRMSVASRTTVGGYDTGTSPTGGQFDVHDTRDVPAFCGDLKRLGLEPVFKNWDRALAGV